MKVILDEDFICIFRGYRATVILRNCDRTCEFCPASKLPIFQNWKKLYSILDCDLDSVEIKGNMNNLHLNHILKELNIPEIKVEGCSCCCSSASEFSRICHPQIASNASNVFPGTFIIPAYGNYAQLLNFVEELRISYGENIKIQIKILDSGDQNIEFWSEEQIKKFCVEANLT